MDPPSKMEDILSKVAAGRSERRNFLSPPHGFDTRSINIPFDGSQIYCDPDHREEDFDEFDQEPVDEAFPSYVYDQLPARLPSPLPSEARFAASPPFDHRRASSFLGHQNPGSDFGDSYHQQPRRPLQQIQLETPTRQRVTESSSPHFAQSSPTPLGPLRLQRQRQRGPALSPSGTLPSTGARLNNAENVAPNILTAGIPSPPRRSSLMRPPQAPIQHRMTSGIQRIAVSELPHKFRGIFPYKEFNDVQSKCLPSIMDTDDNFVMSAPTGSGKTVILELAIVRIMLMSWEKRSKAVYMAPTKALCSERHKDWSAKFGPLGIKCVEFTGDTATGDAGASLQEAQIIITTPEKWDSMTRKWTDNQQCLNLVQLLLIDEVHILQDSRGPTLEIVVSRMKVLGSDVRFIALSATMPNVQDVATWLGLRQGVTDKAALVETFGEEFRPVKLNKYVYGVGQSNGRGNDFHFDAAASKMLPVFITKHSMGLPILVFCPTRSICSSTAKLLSERRASDDEAQQWWKVAHEPMHSSDKALQACLNYSVGYHHAGMQQIDRELVETGFRDGRISVICCTSTLASGVNTPCHLAIIKGTKSWSDEGWSEYSDHDIMQMIGRAGRPQYDHQGAIAVIITAPANVGKYKELSSGREPLESCLHANILEHLNAEVSLGMVTDQMSAQTALKKTFLYVRLGRNASHYRMLGESRASSVNPEVRITNACRRAMETLSQHDLVVAIAENRLESTPSGHAMTRHCLSFKTMLQLTKIPHKADMSDILSQIFQADEFTHIQLRKAERKFYKALNDQQGIRFPLQEVSTGAHKCSLVLQAQLAAMELSTGFSHNIRTGHFQAKSDIFRNIHRMIRCVIECKVALSDAESVRHCLTLERSFCAQVWDDRPEQLTQIEGLGPVRLRLLMSNGIKQMSDLAEADLASLRTMLKTDGVSEKLSARAKAFPCPIVTVSGTMNLAKTDKSPPIVNLAVQVGFMRPSAPILFAGKQVSLVLLVERSDGYLIDFRRIRPARCFQPILLCAELNEPGQKFTCWVSCDAHAGTLRSAEFLPVIPVAGLSIPQKRPAISSMDSPRKLSRKSSKQPQASVAEEHGETFGLSDLDDADLLAAEDENNFRYIEDIETAGQPAKTGKQMTKRPDPRESQRRADGKFECNHQCPDKTVCKHLCCREGLERPPRPRKTAPVDLEKSKPGKLQQSTLQLYNVAKRKKEETDGDIDSEDSLDLLGEKGTPRYSQSLKSISAHVGLSLTTTSQPEHRTIQAAETHGFGLASAVARNAGSTNILFDAGETPPQRDLLSMNKEAHAKDEATAGNTGDEVVGEGDLVRTVGAASGDSHEKFSLMDKVKPVSTLSEKCFDSSESDTPRVNRLPPQTVSRGPPGPSLQPQAVQYFHINADGSCQLGKTTFPASGEPSSMKSDGVLFSVRPRPGSSAPHKQPFKDMTGIDPDLINELKGIVHFEDEHEAED